MRWSLVLVVTACAHAVEAGRRELGGSEVQWTIWSSAGDAAFEGPSTASDLFHADYADGVFDFSHSFRDTVKALGAQQSFTPQFVVLDGSTGQFAAADCTNNGRYCSHDPDRDPNNGIAGRDVVIENLRRICVWKNNPHEKWWDYVSAFSANCDTAEKFADDACYDQAMSEAEIDSSYVSACMSDVGGTTLDKKNDLLEIEMHLAVTKGVTAVEITVDGAPIEQPYTRAAVLGKICAKYDAGHAPAVCGCTSSQSNDAAYDACVARNMPSVVRGGGKQHDAGGPSLGIGWVLLIVAVVFVLAGLGAFIYWKRTQQQMREQVRGILAEYMPLDDDGVPGSKQFNIQSDGGALV